jgi:hypothetical protein
MFKLADVSETISGSIVKAHDVTDALMMEAEMISKTSATFHYLTWLIAREDFINSVRRESFRSYTKVTSLLYEADIIEKRVDFS